MNIYITAKGLALDDLIQQLEALPEWHSQNIQLVLQKKEQPFRTLDPTVIVAIISAASASLGGLITGLLSIAVASKSKTIKLQDKDGRLMEISADTPKEKITEYLELIRQMESPKIEIS